jgi:PAS domain-containing protein
MTFEKHYESIIKTSSIGYVFCKIVKNSDQNPIDLEIIEVNSALENEFQLDAKAITGSSFSTIEPRFFQENKEWISTFDQISSEFNTKYVEKFDDRLKKWISISAFSNQGGYITFLFQDISERKILPEILKVFTSYNYQNVDYNFIAQKAKEISGAKYVIFNKYIENSNTYKTTGISELNNTIEKMTSLLGFDFRNKIWDSDSIMESKIAQKKWIKYEQFSDLSGEIVAPKIINNAAKILGLSHCYLFRSTVDQIKLGDIILIYGKNESIRNIELMETYSDMVGLLINRVNSEQQTTLVHQAFQNYKNLSELIVANTTDTIVVLSFSLNPVYEYISPAVFRNLGYTQDYLIGKHLWDLDIIYPEDKIKIQNTLAQYFSKKDQFEDFTQKSKDVARAEMVIEKTQGLSGDGLVKALAEYKKSGLLTSDVYSWYKKLR